MTTHRTAALILPCALLMAACQSTPTRTPDTPSQTAGPCQDAPLQWAVGQNADEPTMRKLTREAGKVLVNPIGPASIVSHDHRTDRLRVYLDDHNRITAVRCE